MKKITFLVLAFFVLSVLISGVVIAKDTTPAKAKKISKKKVEKVVDPVVYVKENGKKYHKRNCKLVSGKTGLKLSEAVKKGYEPCKACFKSVTVYVTESGKKYHKKDCKHNKKGEAITKELAETKGYEPCSVCCPPPPPKKDLKVKKK